MPKTLKKFSLIATAAALLSMSPTTILSADPLMELIAPDRATTIEIEKKVSVKVTDLILDYAKKLQQKELEELIDELQMMLDLEDLENPKDFELPYPERDDRELCPKGEKCFSPEDFKLPNFGPKK